MKRTILFAILLLALTSLLLVAAQCDEGTAPVPTKPGATAAPGATQPPGGSAYPAATDVPLSPTATVDVASYPPPATLNGEKLLNERCAGCHNLDRVKSAKKTVPEWQKTVGNMIKKGAKLSNEEIVTLVEYLAATYK